MKKFVQIVVSILIAEGAGFLGSIPTFSAITGWYAGLNKPSWSPPNYLFGPVWTTLYLLMGVAAYFVWREQGSKKAQVHNALKYYGAQLGLNALWSVIFFGLKSPGVAFVEILILLIFILLTAGKFWKINKTAGVLLVPYIAWVSFATVLNFAVWQLNH